MTYLERLTATGMNPECAREEVEEHNRHVDALQPESRWA